ncbi:TPA: permease [Candidatus Poribacteria bacterium]|nr:permease [Candidatus Poribacteria bacterium]
MKTEWKKLLLFVAVFLIAYYIPLKHPRIQGAILEAFYMLQDYAQKHVLFCLVPAFFIAGGISVFISQASVMRYFGAQANKILSYGVASISGTILAVCSCTVLPLFAGIYRRGAGIGPATAFLYSGPAINVLAIILTARILGWELGLARALGAIIFSIVIGLLMALFFRKEEAEKANAPMPEIEAEARPLWKTGLYFLSMVFILIFAAWGKPKESVGFWDAVYSVHWYLAGAFLIALILMLIAWFKKDEVKEWVSSTWTFAQMILPLLFGGVLVAGFLMGSPNSDTGLIPSRYIAYVVGGNSFFANFFSSVVGALMYFATLTEVPILQGLIGSGMGQGPALALLLAGPALSLPNMIVIRSIMGTKKTLVFIGLVVIMATFTGMLFGLIMGGV